MTKDRNRNFEEHSIFLSEIATSILEGRNDILSTPGVREIIALYLLIPYITQDQLDAGMPSKMPRLDLMEEFLNGVNLRNLRDTVCHSFLSVEESTPQQTGRIIIDDRSQMDRNTHKAQKIKTLGIAVNVKQVHDRLITLHNKVINSITRHQNDA